MTPTNSEEVAQREEAQRLASQARHHADFVGAIAHHATHEGTNGLLRGAAAHLRAMASFLEKEFDFAPEKPLSKRELKQANESLAHLRRGES